MATSNRLVSSMCGSGRSLRSFEDTLFSRVSFESSKGCACRRSGPLLVVQGRNQEKQVGESGSRRVSLKRGKVSPCLEAPKHIPHPPYVGSRKASLFLNDFQLQDAEGFERMRAYDQFAARVREYAETLVKLGVTTDEIDSAVQQMIIDAGAYPSPLGYRNFPKGMCTSINESICHF